MKTRVYRSLWTGLYYAELLGGEFANCYGQGFTPGHALISLKIRVYQLRAKANAVS